MFYLIAHHIRTYNFIFYDGLSAQCQPDIIACQFPSKNVFPKYSITWICRLLIIFSVYFSYTLISQEYAGLTYTAWMDSSHEWLFYAQFFGDSKMNIYLSFDAKSGCITCNYSREATTLMLKGTKGIDQMRKTFSRAIGAPYVSLKQ